MPIDIVVDAMGSDKAPESEIRGAILAARQYDVRVHLAGPENIIRPVHRQHLRGQHLPVFIVPASEWITMDDKAAQAVRSSATHPCASVSRWSAKAAPVASSR